MVVWLGSACSGGSAAPAPDPTAATPPTAGPLEAYLFPGVGGRTQAEAAAGLAAEEEAIAACMAAQGFDYVPMVMLPGSFEASDGPLRGTREFADAYGYGVWRTPEIEPGQATYLLDDAANRAYRESLGATAQAAYDRALHGAATTTERDGITTTTSDGTGCRDLPTADRDDAAALRGVRQEAHDHLQSLWDGGDPRLAEVDADWAGCMRDAGYTDASPYAAEWRVMTEITEAYEAAPDRYLQPEVVDEYAAAERRMALADLDCREATDWAARRRAVEHELQQEYVDVHRADLEALLAAMRDAPAAD